MTPLQQLNLSTSVAALGKVGVTTASRLAKLGISTLEDLIFYYPFRYDDLSETITVADARPGAVVTISGTVEDIGSRRAWKRKTIVTEAFIRDATGVVKCVWFNQPFIVKTLHAGDTVFLSGKVSLDHGALVLSNPVYEKEKQSGEQLHTGRIVPIYSLTKGITHKQLRWLIKQSLSQVKVSEWLPESIRTRFELIELNEALRQIHFPDSQASLDRALNRIKFNELFLFFLQSLTIRTAFRQSRTWQIQFYQTAAKQFVNSLDFSLTDDQKKAAWQILLDTGKTYPMNRLLEGEVGSGKTVVATLAAFMVAQNGFQTVIMAPTEILAQQHFKTIRTLFDQVVAAGSVTIGSQRPEGVVALLTRSSQKLNAKNTTKKMIANKVAAGEVDVVVGTHSLLQDMVDLHNVALVVIDEQHRFGVEQRKILHTKASTQAKVPHFLSMTATPIPRSLALSVYGDLDVSIIRQLPKGRKKIATTIAHPSEREAVYVEIEKEISSGRQAYVICPLVEDSEKLGVTSVATEYKRLVERFDRYRVGVLHGKMKQERKDVIMKEFAAGEIDILVATTVVEVGINVPNATIMLIEDAERFGLAQLYQLRGRVGRGEYQSTCVLMTSKKNTHTKKRLEAVLSARDSFELAEYDLAMRGPGDMFGVSQTGFPAFKIASLFEYSWVRTAQQAAETILAEDPELQHYTELQKVLTELQQTVHRE